jgi:hypothetical protein
MIALAPLLIIGVTRSASSSKPGTISINQLLRYPSTGARAMPPQDQL